MKLINQRRAVISYARDKRRNPVGLAIAYKANNGKIMVGYSKCATKLGDTFDRDAGLRFALQRAVPIEEAKSDLGKFPHSVRSTIKDTIERAERYFLLTRSAKMRAHWKTKKCASTKKS